MSRKSITLAFGVVVLAALAGVYFLLGNYNEKQEEAAEEAASGETILEIDTDALTAAAFSIDGTEQTFTKHGEEWTLESDDTFPVDASSLLSILSGLTPLKAHRTLTGISDISEYGLDEPQNTVTLTDSDENTTVITFGDANSGTSDNYLMLDEDGSTVYTVDSTFLDNLSQDLYDYALSEDLPSLTSDTITGILVSGSSNDYELAKTGDIWMVAVGEEGAREAAEEADGDEVSTLLSQLTTIYYVDYLDHNCSDLSAYGLDDPTALLTVTWEEDADSEATADAEPETEKTAMGSGRTPCSVTFTIGATDDSGNYFVQMEGSTQVHTLSSYLVETILDCDLEDLIAEEETQTGAE